MKQAIGPGRAHSLLHLMVLLMACCFCFNGRAASLDLATSATIRDLPRYVDILEDRTGQRPVGSLLQGSDTVWSKTGEQALQISYSTSVWWIRFELENSGDTPLTRILEVGWPLLNYLDVYVYEGNQMSMQVLTGDQRPFANRPLNTRSFTIPLKTDPGHHQTVFLRLAMQGGIFYAVPLHLWVNQDFYDQLSIENLIQGAYLGAILALLLYNVLLFLSTQDNNLLLYSFYLGGFTLWNIGFNGLGMQYLWTDAAWFNLQFNLLIPAYLHGLSTLFVVRYLETRERTPFLHRLIMSVTALTLLVMPFALANQNDPDFPIVGPAYFFSTMSSLLIVLYMTAGIWLMLHRFGPARYFVLAWSCLFLGIFIYRSTQFPGLGIPDHPLIKNSINLGSALEFLLLALALGDRFNRMRNEKLAAEQEAYRLQLNYSNDLAEQVEYRTTELQNTMQQLHLALKAEQQAQEEQKQFLATVSHELRTPLAVIDIVAQNLEIEEPNASEAARRARYDKILQATRRLSSLLDDYLDENRFSLPRQGPRRQLTDMRQLLDDAAHSARILADRHCLIVDSDRIDTHFTCDPDLTRLALRNLADNAVKYTPPGTVVILSAWMDTNGVNLMVEDEGTGLSEKTLDRLFLPGERGQNTGDKPGRGMGLSLARRMIEIQGGTLTATSQAGKGCSFRIWLPDIPPQTTCLPPETA